MPNKPVQSVTSQNANKQIAAIMKSEFYVGPIPPAAELQKYENIQPGFADRILTMAEKQEAHRQKLETKMLDEGIKSERIGQIFGFIIFSAVLIAGFILTLLNKSVEGVITILGSAGSIIGLFIYGRKSAKQELKDKKQGIKNN